MLLLNLYQPESNESSLDKMISDAKSVKGSWKKKLIMKRALSNKNSKKSLSDRPFNNHKAYVKQDSNETRPVEKMNTNSPTVKLSHQTPVVSTSFNKKFIKTDVNTDVTVFSKNSSFENLGIHESISRHLREKMNLSVPTVIQSLAIPQLLAHRARDVCIQSITGSGKSLSFLLPIIQSILAESEHQNRQEGTLAIILSPTRELAQQLYALLDKILNTSFKMEERSGSLVPGIIVGGDKRKSEKARLRKGIQILVCTPGRLLDHLENTESFKLNNLKYFVLDEADRLMDLGFGEKIKKIVSLIKESTKERQLCKILCSATLQGRVVSLADELMNEPLYIKTQEEEEESKFATPEGLVQKYLNCPPKFRLLTLIALLRSKILDIKSTVSCKTIIFVSCCASVDFHHALLCTGKIPKVEDGKFKESSDAYYDMEPLDKEGMPAVASSTLFSSTKIFKLHGSLSQVDRFKVFDDFSKCSRGILVCTDVAARGLDLPAVNYIIQYEPPSDIRDYIHRVGRTARIGQKGEAILFLLPSEIEYVELLQEKNVEMEALEMEHVLVSLTNDESTYKEFAVQLQYGLERLVGSKVC
jgi:ATP-dependent RNA helicase DDX31/DBP7